jgi:site-specific recombinase XerD
MKLSDAIDQFLQHLELEKNRSLHTIESYAHYLNRFATWAEEQGVVDLNQVTEEQVLRFRQFLNRIEMKDGESLSKSTQNYHLIALRSWLKFLNRKGYEAIPADRIDLPKPDARQIQFLEHEELMRLLTQPKAASLKGKRDMAILYVLFSTGLRVSEIASLNREQVNLERGEFAVIGKGRKERIVFLSDEAKRFIEEYLSARRDDDSALFIRMKDPVPEAEQELDRTLRLSDRSIERIVKAHAKAAGITKTVTPHTLRHSFATDLLMNGANIRDVQAMLGHSSLNTTQIYTHVTNQHLKDVHAAFHGRRNEVESEVSTKKQEVDQNEENTEPGILPN